MNAYRLTIFHSDKRYLSSSRVIHRQTDEEAIDGAQRWLRMHRRNSPAVKPFDMWSVMRTDPKTGLPKVISNGYADESHT